MANTKLQQVIYFFTQPADLSLTDAVLIFSLQPRLRLTTNHPQVQVGLLKVSEQIDSGGKKSREIYGNASPLDLQEYFQITDNLDTVRSSFRYSASESVLLTVVVYTSSEAVSSSGSQLTATIPEHYGTLTYIFLGLVSLIKSR